MAETFSITILWGEAPDLGAGPETFNFDTQAELNAFLLGVQAGDGWMAYEIVPQGKWFRPGQRVRLLGPIVGATARAGEILEYCGDMQFRVVFDDGSTEDLNNTQLEAEE